MEELYDPTENSVIGADVAYTLTLSETDEIFTQDILLMPRENTSEPSTGFMWSFPESNDKIGSFGRI